jgi:hypothetical protein
VYDEEETEEEDTTEQRDSEKWSWLEFYALMVRMVATYCKLWGVLFDSTAELMEKHRRYKDSRVDFHERAAIEMEALTREAGAEVKG